MWGHGPKAGDSRIIHRWASAQEENTFEKLSEKGFFLQSANGVDFRRQLCAQRPNRADDCFDPGFRAKSHRFWRAQTQMAAARIREAQPLREPPSLANCFFRALWSAARRSRSRLCPPQGRWPGAAQKPRWRRSEE